MANVPTDKLKAAESALSQIERQFGKGSIMRLGAKEFSAISAISTGSIGVDAALGVGGVPRGRIVEIFGPESSGKTTLSLHVIAEAQLRCAARLHSMDMAVRGFFDHTNPDGESPWDRVDETDYTGFASGENIAAGYPDPAAVMEGWMNSPGHCSNIMNPDNDELGVGYYEGDYWTQVMGQRE